MQNLLINFTGIFTDLWGQMGMSQGGWQNYVMLLISFVLMFLAIVKKYEPMLLLPIAFGMFLINLPGAERILWGVHNEIPDTSLKLGINGSIENVGVYVLNNAGDTVIYLREGFLNGDTVSYYASFEALQQGAGALSTMELAEFNSLYTLQGFVQGAVSGDTVTFVSDKLVLLSEYESVTERGLLWYLYYGVDKVIYPPLIFLGIGAMTDFGPLIANPKSMFIGAGAQLGIFVALFGAVLLGFTGAESAAIAIIGGADGPTAIYVSKMLAEHLVPTIAIAAYSYMALIPAIQKPVMRLLTTKKERAIRMKPLRQVSKAEKIIFPVAVTLVVGLLLPDAIPLLGMLMLGNLFRESGVVERLSSQAQNGLINTITIFLGISVGCKAKGGIFLTTQTLGILAIGIIAFYLGTIGGILVAKLMCKLTKGKINPLIGSAGVSAVPMAARISEDVGRETDPSNHLLMHAMGPNVAGVIGSALAAGVLLAIF
ncbi:MAG: sodium ion-translocating decarboxylase subunit beta [Clostridia bacterium]|nr:sodium ion-translocating decarboxylase subunit beta [Clostridia bacterium]